MKNMNHFFRSKSAYFYGIPQSTIWTNFILKSVDDKRSPHKIFIHVPILYLFLCCKFHLMHSCTQQPMCYARLFLRHLAWSVIWSLSFGKQQKLFCSDASAIPRQSLIWVRESESQRKRRYVREGCDCPCSALRDENRTALGLFLGRQ